MPTMGRSQPFPLPFPLPPARATSLLRIAAHESGEACRVIARDRRLARAGVGLDSARTRGRRSTWCAEALRPRSAAAARPRRRAPPGSPPAREAKEKGERARSGAGKVGQGVGGGCGGGRSLAICAQCVRCPGERLGGTPLARPPGQLRATASGADKRGSVALRPRCRARGCRGAARTSSHERSMCFFSGATIMAMGTMACLTILQAIVPGKQRCKQSNAVRTVSCRSCRRRCAAASARASRRERLAPSCAAPASESDLCIRERPHTSGMARV